MASGFARHDQSQRVRTIASRDSLRELDHSTATQCGRTWPRPTASHAGRRTILLAMPLRCTGVETPDWREGNGRTLRKTRIAPGCVTSTRQECLKSSTTAVQQPEPTIRHRGPRKRVATLPDWYQTDTVGPREGTARHVPCQYRTAFRARRRQHSSSRRRTTRPPTGTTGATVRRATATVARATRTSASTAAPNRAGAPSRRPEDR